MRFFKIYVLISSLILIGLAVFYYSTDKPVSVYKGQEGTRIISYSNNWKDVKKLELLYHELLNNFHGEELKYLEGIYLYPQKEDVAAYYYDDYYERDGGISLGKKARIEIYNMDEYNQIEEIARVLAHEYGHHFTTYYLIEKERKGQKQWTETEYAKIRQFYMYPLVKSYDDKLDPLKHRWDISEIAAEDYVQLFGSDLARNSIDFKDVEERLEDSIYQYSYTNVDFNLIPQENLDIPLAADVVGLFEYWYEKVTGTKPVIMPQTLSYTNLIIEENDVLEGYKSHLVNWIPINDAEEYTLIMYPKGDNSFPEPIKRIEKSDKTVARLGSGIKSLDDGRVNAIKKDLKGTYSLTLFARDQFGFIHRVADEDINFK
ncbi:hypothetical protein [Vallitalea okinawensis]|uniref:hypothetical protein n=1 Tax=Vallitalea okinawensis TaxID=2078660 RepID=UPI000CFC8FFD|nr:hypothetical protein [Vallitalea okinawensis]